MRNMMIGLVLSVLLVFGVSVGIAQVIIVRDNASTTAPIDDVRSFGSSYKSLVGTVEVEDATALTEPLQAGVVFFQFNADDAKLNLRFIAADEKTYEANIQMAEVQ